MKNNINNNSKKKNIYPLGNKYYSTKCFIFMNLFNPHNRNCYYLYYTDEETEAGKGGISFSDSLLVGEGASRL